MKFKRARFQRMPWSGVTTSEATLALARVTAVAISLDRGAVTFRDVAEAMAADGLECPPAAIVFTSGMFTPVGPADGRPAWKAV